MIAELVASVKKNAKKNCCREGSADPTHKEKLNPDPPKTTKLVPDLNKTGFGSPSLKQAGIWIRLTKPSWNLDLACTKSWIRIRLT